MRRNGYHCFLSVVGAEDTARSAPASLGPEGRSAPRVFRAGARSGNGAAQRRLVHTSSEGAVCAAVACRGTYSAAGSSGPLPEAGASGAGARRE